MYPMRVMQWLPAARYGWFNPSTTCRPPPCPKGDDGQEDRIRPCVGAVYCLGRIYEGHEGSLHPQPIYRARGHASACHPSCAGATPGGDRRCRSRRAGGLPARRPNGGHKVIIFEAQDKPRRSNSAHHPHQTPCRTGSDRGLAHCRARTGLGVGSALQCSWPRRKTCSKRALILW